MSDPYVLQRASIQASLLIATAGFPRDDWPDLRQEFLLDLLRRSPRFNERRGEWHSFVRGIMRNHATVLIQRRNRRRQEVFIEDVAEHELHGRWNGKCASDPARRLATDISVRQVVSRLPARQQMLLRLLPFYSVPEACQRLGCSRSQAYRFIEDAREDFVRAGLSGPKDRR
jgi:DNA-directed RNA polymerase specialized sigma24 family protein